MIGEQMKMDAAAGGTSASVAETTDGLVDRADRLARAALCRLAEPGDLLLAHWLERLGAVELLRDLRKGAGSPDLPDSWRARLAAVHPERDLESIRALRGRFICPGDDEWPAALAALATCAVDRQGGLPVGLWMRGTPALSAAVVKSVAIVGARAATSYGEYVAAEWASELAEQGFTVVSGAAYGIDGAAHRGCLAAGGLTVAVLANGLDIDYPSGHRALLHRIGEEGLVVSELPPGARPSRSRFLARNRMIAGLAKGTVVVEAALRSGATNTVSWTAEMDRPAMGVPGPITSTASAGVHQMIRQTKAAFVTSSADIVEMLSPIGESLSPHRSGEVLDRDLLAPRTATVLEAVPSARAVGVATIASRAGLRIDQTLAELGSLLLAGHVERSGSGWRLSRGERRAVAARRKGA
jgi:DNA processing protein